MLGVRYQLSSLLDLGNGVSLKELAEEARHENTIVRRLAEKSAGDAAAVKVLTIITLIYLPVNVVSVCPLPELLEDVCILIQQRPSSPPCS